MADDAPAVEMTAPPMLAAPCPARPTRHQRHLWLGPVLTAPATARQAATEFLGSCGLAELAETTAQVVSELVTNAVLVSRTSVDSRRPIPPPIGFTLSAESGRVLVEVWDCSEDPPVVLLPGTYSENGRGLFLVACLSEMWGWSDAQRGKCVWAEIAKESAQ